MFHDQLALLKQQEMLRALSTFGSADGTRAFIRGREYTIFCTNDYLGLARHPKVTAAAERAAREFGAGSGSAPLIAGHATCHRELEEKLAAFKSAGAAMLFGSGYLANAGAIPALADEGDLILSDELNHASIIDGCRLSKARVDIYRHRDMEHLGRLLKDARGGRTLIVTEGVFSMDGDVAPLREVVRLARESGALVLLDDAHATGTIGKTGRGTPEYHGIAPAEDIIQMGTLGKALGSYGAFVAAGNETVSWLVNAARSFIFSTALPPSACAAASAALDVIRDEPGRLAVLGENATNLRASLRALGYKVLGEDTPIVPVVTGDARSAVRLAARLMESGFYAPAIRPPSVPEDACRIRLTVSALHTPAEIGALVDAFKRYA